VRAGGNLLVTGPAARDEHWHAVDRLTPLGVSASLEPLTMHWARQGATTSGPGAPFDQQKQLLAEYWKFSDGSTQKEVVLGKGRLFLDAYPIEVSNDSSFAAQAYTNIVARTGIAAPFQFRGEAPAGVLIYPMELKDSVFYVLESETNADTNIDLKDAATGARLRLRLPAERGALALIDKATKTVVAQYGF